MEDLQVRVPRHEKAKLNFEVLEEGRINASVLNEEGEAVLGLQKEDFVIRAGNKTAKIISVEDMRETKDIGLNLVLVVDNSYSMKRRKAIQPLLAALTEFLATVRPIDNVQVVTFIDPPGFYDSQGKDLPMISTRVMQSSDVGEIKQSLNDSFSAEITTGTFLYDAMLKGLEIIAQLPAKSRKFMVIFSDGEDINSSVEAEQVEAAAKNLTNLSVLAVDYMDRPGLDPFLSSFSETNDGMIRKASSASDFLPIFKSFSTTIFHRYIVAYRFLNPPAGTVAMTPATVNVEEITMLDSSPLLNYIYFDTGSNQIPSKYNMFSNRSEAGSFAEEKLTGTLEKYYHVLNIIGKRLEDNPEAMVTIVGCNSNTGPEKGQLVLSKSRAEEVAAYLRNVWSIDPARMEIKAQNLPAVPTSSRLPEGVAENQRVEIHSDHPAILDTIKSVYVESLVDTGEIRVSHDISAEAGVKNWNYRLTDGATVLQTLNGEGEPPSEFVFDLSSLGAGNVANLGPITANLQVLDTEGNEYLAHSVTPTNIHIIRREERIAQKLDYKVVEKYALILFEFDRSDLKERNRVIVDRIITRLAELPSAFAKITGHTDIIGKEKYNLDLSARRATAVFEAMSTPPLPAVIQMSREGVGPFSPPYDNGTPEGRALNRTVVITVQYMEKNESSSVNN